MKEYIYIYSYILITIYIYIYILRKIKVIILIIVVPHLKLISSFNELFSYSYITADIDDLFDLADNVVGD